MAEVERVPLWATVIEAVEVARFLEFARHARAVKKHAVQPCGAGARRPNRDEVGQPQARRLPATPHFSEFGRYESFPLHPQYLCKPFGPVRTSGRELEQLLTQTAYNLGQSGPSRSF